MPGNRYGERLARLYDGEDEKFFLARPEPLEDPAVTCELAVRVHSHEECECGHPWEVEVWAIAPELLPADAWERALYGIGLTPQDVKEMGWDPRLRIQTLIDHGFGVPVWRVEGNNLRKLLADARREVRMVRGMFGFYMDRAYNGIGTTGWDLLRDDLEAPLRRYREARAA